MIELNNVTKCFEKNQPAVLENVSLQIQTGEYVSIMGKSGSGKSTLVSLIGGLDRPDQGTIRLFDQEITQMGDHQLALFRRQQIGFVFQAFHLISELTVLDNLTLPLGYLGYSANERKKVGLEILALIDLNGKEKLYPNQLSGGEKQRVAIGRAVIAQPNIIIADEPTGNLDETREQGTMNLLTRLNEAGKTILLVTHDQEISQFAQRHLLIKNGKVEEYVDEKTFD